MTSVGVFEQHRQERVQAVDHAPQVHAEHPLPVGEGLVHDQPAAADARVVAQQMCGAEPLTNVVRERLHRSRVADVGAHPHHAELGRRRIERTSLDVGDHDVHARIAESSRERLADATCAARHDRDFAPEHAHAAESTVRSVGGAVPRRYRGLGVGTIALMVAGTVFTFLAALSLWSWRTFASSEGFADVTTDMLKEPALDEILAEQIVTALEAQPEVARVGAATRPALVELVKDVIQTPPFQSLFHAAVLELHASIAAGRRQNDGLQLNRRAAAVQGRACGW